MLEKEEIFGRVEGKTKLTEPRTVKELKRLLTGGMPGPSLKAAALLYLHRVRISTSIRLRVGNIAFGASPAAVLVDGERLVTDLLSSVLRELSAGKSGADLLLGS